MDCVPGGAQKWSRNILDKQLNVLKITMSNIFSEKCIDVTNPLDCQCLALNETIWQNDVKEKVSELLGNTDPSSTDTSESNHFKVFHVEFSRIENRVNLL